MMANTTNGKNNSLFYNPELKNAFLSTISNEGTIKAYARIFGITAKYEEALDKDLNQFSLEEIEKILYDFKANNRHTIETYGRVISSYLNWCVEENVVEHNPMAELTSEDFDKYVVDENVYFSEQQLRKYEDQCVNYQDAVVLRLLFEGVGGKQVSEIRNLKVNDVDFENNTLHLVNSFQVDKKGLPVKFTERVIKVEDRTMYLIKGAIEQTTYTKRNGYMDRSADNVREFTDLVQNEYVIRASITKNSDYINVPVDKHVIYRRVQIIQETLGIKELTPKIIQRSGMLYQASKLIGDGDKVTLEDLKIIADRFGINSYHNLKSFLTIENVRKLYPKKN